MTDLEVSAGLLRRRGLLLLAVVIVVGALLSARLESALGHPLFDAWQRFEPRQRVSAPALIVAIDEESLQAYGAWPWPRSLMAQLAERIANLAPAAVGVDILFVDPDPFAPARLAAAIPGLGATARHQLDALPDGDARLAAVLASGPFVIARAGVDSGAIAPGGRRASFRLRGGDPLSTLPRFPGLLGGVPAIVAAAPGQGLVNAGLDDGIVRRLPLAYNIGGEAMPTLSLAMLHQAGGQPVLNVVANDRGIESIGLGDLRLPVALDGQAWIRFARHDPARFVSAKAVLDGRVAPEAVGGKLVLVGFAALGLMDVVMTPLGERLPGVEVHAQLLENIFDGTLLRRPAAMRVVEFGLAAAAGLLLVLAVPVLRGGRAWLLWLLLVGAALLASWSAFHAGVLVDAATMIALLSATFAGVLGMTLAETEAQRRRLDAALAREREAAIRLEGEFAAAQRVQLGILPLPGGLRQDPRYQLAASMVAAKQVGGDLYDFFLLDAHRLCFLIGDVSGKGLAASLFMALSKTLCKSVALRGAGSPSEVLVAANTEIARDNPELLFITAVVGILDLDTGELQWARAGHDAPYLLPATGAPIARLTEDGGPPLCVVDDYPFADARTRLLPGDTLVLLTDGILEAQNSAGRFYGRDELDERFETLRTAANTQAIVDGLMADVVAHTGDADLADDATILVIRWHGPGGAKPALAVSGC